MNDREVGTHTGGWEEQLRDVVAEARALTQKMQRVREVLPPSQSGMALRLQEFEDRLEELFNDVSIQHLLEQ
jgi:hypothetical protein